MAIGTQTLVSGTRSTVNAYISGNSLLPVRDVEPKIKLLNPIPVPLDNFYYNNKLANQVTSGVAGKFEWNEDAFVPSTTTLAEAILATSSAQTIDVTAQIFLVNDVILVESTNETFYVSAISGTAGEAGAVTMIRTNGATATAAAIGVTIHKLPPSFASGSAKATSLTSVAVTKVAYTQIIKYGFSSTGSEQATDTYGDGWNYQFPKKLYEGRLLIEQAYMNNGASTIDTTTATTGAIKYMAGFNSLTTNSFAYVDPLDKSEFDSYLTQTLGNTDSLDYMILAGGNACMDLNAFMTSIWSIMQNDPRFKLDTYGIMQATPQDTTLVTYVHPLGAKFPIHWAPQLKGKYANDLIVINKANVKKRYAKEDKKGPRKYRVEMGIETPGDDKTDAQYLFDIGQQILLEETHARITKQ